MLHINPSPDHFANLRNDSFYTVICGANNSGKSYTFKERKRVMGRRAYMAGSQRFYHVYELNTQRYESKYYDDLERQYHQERTNESYNYEHNYIDLGRIIGGLKDTRRDEHFEICGNLIGARFSLKRRDEDNEMSARYVDMDGQNFSLGSSGSRLLMTLIGLCMDENYEVLFIDEPELGLAPKIQHNLGQLFSDEQEMRKRFPKLKQLFVATHSHLMLDRRNIGNNFVVRRTSDAVSIEQVSDLSRFHELQFNLLGNTLESLFLPAAIIIVEGKTDKPFFERVCRVRFPDRNIVVLDAQGDVKRVLRSVVSAYGDAAKSPFRPRTFVILDSVHTPGTAADLVAMGAPSENVVVWSRNGVEYAYPREIMRQIFACSDLELDGMSITGDMVTVGSVSRRKVELANEVVARLLPTTSIGAELEGKLLEPLQKVIG